MPKMGEHRAECVHLGQTPPPPLPQRLQTPILRTRSIRTPPVLVLLHPPAPLSLPRQQFGRAHRIGRGRAGLTRGHSHKKMSLRPACAGPQDARDARSWALRFELGLRWWWCHTGTHTDPHPRGVVAVVKGLDPGIWVLWWPSCQARYDPWFCMRGGPADPWEWPRPLQRPGLYSPRALLLHICTKGIEGTF